MVPQILVISCFLTRMGVYPFTSVKILISVVTIFISFVAIFVNWPRHAL